MQRRRSWSVLRAVRVERFQNLAQLPARVEHACLHRVDRAAGDSGDLAVRTAGEERQLDDEALLGRELVEPAPQPVALLEAAALRGRQLVDLRHRRRLAALLALEG